MEKSNFDIRRDRNALLDEEKGASTAGSGRTSTVSEAIKGCLPAEQATAATIVKAL